MDSLWLEVKTEGETDYTPIIGISATVLLAAVYLTARGVRDRRRRANRCKKWKTCREKFRRDFSLSKSLAEGLV